MRRFIVTRQLGNIESFKSTGGFLLFPLLLNIAVYDLLIEIAGGHDLNAAVDRAIGHDHRIGAQFLFDHTHGLTYICCKKAFYFHRLSS